MEGVQLLPLAQCHLVITIHHTGTNSLISLQMVSTIYTMCFIL